MAQGPSEVEAEFSEADVDRISSLLDEYATATPERQAEMFAEHSDDLLAGGASPIVHVDPDDSFEPINSHDPRFKGIVRDGRLRLSSLIDQARTGQLYAHPDVVEQIEELVIDAEHPDDAISGEAVQRLEHLIDLVKEEHRRLEPWGDRTTLRYSKPLAGGGSEITERDNLGHTRITRLSAKEVEEAESEFEQAETLSERPWGDAPTRVTATQLASWPDDVQIRFMEEHPEHVDNLLQNAEFDEGE